MALSSLEGLVSILRLFLLEDCLILLWLWILSLDFIGIVCVNYWSFVQVVPMLLHRPYSLSFMNDRKPTLLMFVQTFLGMCIFLILKNQKLHQLLSCLYLRFTCSAHFISMIYERWSNVHVNCTCYLLKLNTSEKDSSWVMSQVPL